MNEILNEQEEALLNATIEEIYQEHFSSPAIPKMKSQHSWILLPVDLVLPRGTKELKIRISY